MSYTIELKQRSGSAKAFLGAMRHALRRFEATEDMGDLFDYVNDSTDVHFQFELGPLDRIEPDDGPATLVINFARPSPFVREAAAVMAEVARNVPLLCIDHQVGDEDWRPFDPDQLIADYTDHAGRAVSSLMRSMDDHGFARHRAPRPLLNYVWNWNFDRPNKDKRRKKDDRNIWVPKLEFVEIEGRLFTYCAWFDGVATLFPKCDLIGITRNKYPAKSGFMGLGAKRPTLEFIPRPSADQIMGDTYQTDPVWPEATSPVTDGGVAGQDRFLARAVGIDAVCDPIFLDRDDYKNRSVKPFRRIKFHDILDDEFFDD